MNRASLNISVRSNFVDFVYAVSKFHEKQRKQESTDISRFGVFVGILLGNNKSSYPTHINKPLSNSTSFNRPLVTVYYCQNRYLFKTRHFVV